MSIKITHKNKEYILEYTRTTVRRMEQSGFNAELLESQPATMIPLLVYGAFAHKHPTLKAPKIDEIYDSIKGKQKFITELGKMYYETISTLVADDEEDAEGNENWEIV